MTSEDAVGKAQENRNRRRAHRLGLALRKSRARDLHIDNLGDYMLVDPYLNAIVWGEKYDLSLDDVEGYLDEAEQRLTSERVSGRPARQEGRTGR